MAQQHINLGTPPNGTDGDANRTAWLKAEANFNELYDGSIPIGGTKTFASIVITSGDFVAPAGARVDAYFTGDAADSSGMSQVVLWGRAPNAMAGAEKRFAYVGYSLFGATAGNRGGRVSVGVKSNGASTLTEHLEVTPGKVSVLSAGLSLGSSLASSATDLSKHLILHEDGYGFSITSGIQNYVSAGEHVFYSGGTAGLRVIAAAISPIGDGGMSCGLVTRRWTTVYAQTGAINTSDEREKTDVDALVDAELAASEAMASEIGTYQWLSAVAEKGADARRHVGLTVQRAIEIMQAHGLDPFRYGFICHDEWGETPEIVEDVELGHVVNDAQPDVILYADVPASKAGEGQTWTYQRTVSVVVQQHHAAGDRYSFRHDELLLFIARGLKNVLDRHEARLAALEASA